MKYSISTRYESECIKRISQRENPIVRNEIPFTRYLIKLNIEKYSARGAEMRESGKMRKDSNKSKKKRMLRECGDLCGCGIGHPQGRWPTTHTNHSPPSRKTEENEI
jgi:hypothetical protein